MMLPSNAISSVRQRGLSSQIKPTSSTVAFDIWGKSKYPNKLFVIILFRYEKHYFYLSANLREEDEVTDTETEAWWTWDPGLDGLPCTRQTYSPESSGVADRMRSWLPRTYTQQTRTRLSSAWKTTHHFYYDTSSVSTASHSKNLEIRYLYQHLRHI